jgi:hypothetical protein
MPTSMPALSAAPELFVPVDACPACGEAGGRVMAEPCTENKFSSYLRHQGVPLDTVRLVR